MCVSEERKRQRKTREEIFSIIYERMLYYNYIDDLNSQHQKLLSETIDKISKKGKRDSLDILSHSITPKDLSIVKNILRGKNWELILDPVTSQTTPTIYDVTGKFSAVSKKASADEILQEIRKKGWVSQDHIERPAPPYPFPNKKRYDYLNNALLVERSKLTAVTTMGRSKKRKTLTLYRLRRDSEAVFLLADEYLFKMPLANYFTSLLDYELVGGAHALIGLQALMLQKFYLKRLPDEKRQLALRSLDKVKNALVGRDLTRSKEAPAEKGQEVRKPPLIFPSKPFFEGGFSIKTSRHGEYAS